MRNTTSGRLRDVAIAGLLLFLTSGCGSAVYYDPPTVTEESLAAIQPTEQERAKQSSSVTHTTDDLSLERRRWSKLTKEGRIQLRMGNLGAAEQNFVAAAEIARSFRRSDRRWHAGIGNLKRVATAYKEQRHVVAFVRVAEVIRLDTMGTSEIESPGLTELLIVLGGIYIEMGFYDEAQVVLDEALALRVEREGNQATSLVDIYAPMAELALLQDDFKTAEERSRRRLELALAPGNLSDDRVIAAQLQLGHILLKQEKHEEAETLLNRALASQQRRGVQPAEIAIVQNALATLYLDTDRLSLAQETVDAGLASLDELGVQGIFLANLLDTRAQVLASRGRPKEADKDFKRAIEESATAPNSQRVKLLESYGEFLKARKRGKEVSKLQAQIDSLNQETLATQTRVRESVAGPRPAAAPDWEQTADSSTATP